MNYNKSMGCLGTPLWIFIFVSYIHEAGSKGSLDLFAVMFMVLVIVGGFWLIFADDGYSSGSEATTEQSQRTVTRISDAAMRQMQELSDDYIRGVLNGEDRRR